MSKNNLVTCLRLEEELIYIAVVDPDSAEIILSDGLGINFPLINAAGILAEPERLGEFLKKYIHDHDLPQTIKISIGLKYIDIKLLHLPTMLENELEPVILDEAVRESIFSFSGGTIDMAYEVLSDTPSQFENELKMNILAATIPQEVLDGYVAMAKTAGLKLIAIQPDLAGFRRLLTSEKSEHDEIFLLLRVTSADAELFIWEKSYPIFWRYLSTGAKQPERLRQEIETTLEHVETKTGQSLNAPKILLSGPAIPELSEIGFQPETMPTGEWSDLLGIGLLSTHRRDFNFLKQAATRPEYSLTIPPAVYWILLVGLILFNFWRAWYLKDLCIRYQAVLQKNKMFQQTLEKEQTQLQNWQNKGLPISRAPNDRKMPVWLETLRAYTPTDIRLNSIEYDRIQHVMTISGISLSNASVRRFIQVLSGMDNVKSIDDFQSGEQTQTPLNLKNFEVKVTLEEPKS